MSFAKQVISFHTSLTPNWRLPKGFELIFPFDNDETIEVFSSFYEKYLADNQARTYLFGINPGRFGAGVTGIPFTDPKITEEVCGISNSFKKRNELSSIFIYEMIDTLGGPAKFYKDFYITSICQLGFIKDGKNINYYDDKSLQKSVEKKIISNIKTQLDFGANRDIAFSIGRGKNFKYFQEINKKHGFFKEVADLPHPRWVMQYKLKSKQIYIDEYVTKLHPLQS